MEAAAECEATEHLLSSALTPVERRVVELFYGLAEHDSHTVPQVAAVQGCTLNEVRSNPNPSPSPSPNSSANPNPNPNPNPTPNPHPYPDQVRADLGRAMRKMRKMGDALKLEDYAVPS